VSVVEVGFGLADLSRLRRLVVEAALGAELPRERADRLAVAVNEIATNALVHGRPPATLRIRRERDRLVCEVSDRGAGIKDALAGRLRPSPDALGGRGLWLARQLCDEVEIRHGVGCTVSVHALAPDSGATVA
jgi:anti-sigma regulatory factor (Ser/Thr protein kinase)